MLFALQPLPPPLSQHQSGSNYIGLHNQASLRKTSPWAAPLLPVTRELQPPPPLLSASPSLPPYKSKETAVESFEMQQQQQHQQEQPQASEAVPAPVAAAATPASSRRPSATLSACLSDSDLPLSALAASRQASNTATRGSSEQGHLATGTSQEEPPGARMLRFSGCQNSGSDQAGSTQQQQQQQQDAACLSALDGDCELLVQLGSSFFAPAQQVPPSSLVSSPPAAPVPPTRPLLQLQDQRIGSAVDALRLGTGKLAALRESLLELSMDGAASLGPGTAIPDALVLQELRSRLGRLDSAKRRLLLEVLERIDGMQGGPEAAASGGFGAATGCLLSAGGTVKEQAAGGGVQATEPLLQQLRQSSHHLQRLPQEQEQQREQGLSPPPLPLAQPACPLVSPSPRRGLAGKLAALRGLGWSPSKAAAAAAAAAAMTAPAAVYNPQRPPGHHEQRLQRQGEDALGRFEQAAAARHSTVALPTRKQSGVAAAAAGTHALDVLETAAPAPAPTAASLGPPAGRVLQLVIRSTQGDPHYVGLCAIELWDTAGRPVCGLDPPPDRATGDGDSGSTTKARSVAITAEPHSINVLPEYSGDPRTPDKLLDGERGELGLAARNRTFAPASLCCICQTATKTSLPAAHGMLQAMCSPAMTAACGSAPFLPRGRPPSSRSRCRRPLPWARCESGTTTSAQGCTCCVAHGLWSCCWMVGIWQHLSCALHRVQPPPRRWRPQSCWCCTPALLCTQLWRHATSRS